MEDLKYVIRFNNTLLKLCTLIKKESPNSIVGNNYLVIKNTLENSTSESYLLTFAEKITINKVFSEQIMNGNDAFFLNGYDNNYYASNTGLPLNSILDFKDLWLKKLTKESKNKIKKYLKLMLVSSTKYLEEMKQM